MQVACYSVKLHYEQPVIKMHSFRNLDIYKRAYSLAIKAHQLSLELPGYEIYEQGSQLRRSTKRIKDTIAEGFGRRKYKDEFIRFLIFAHSSCDESLSQLDMINELHFKERPINDLIEEYKYLGRQINKFIQYVETNWK